jgi:multicomponent Na+:H+ antiporter subunit D
VAVYVLLRFTFTVFGLEFSFGAAPLSLILATLAVAAILVGSVSAVTQNNVKRLLAYSSVAQIGYMVVAIAMVTALGLTAATLHLFNHALMKGALFLALGCVVYRMGGADMDSLRGLGRKMPLTMAAFVVAGLSLIGVPLTAGFISKWYLVLAAIELGWWPIVAVVLVGSLLAAIYIWRVVEVAYFREADDPARSEAPWSLLAPTWLLALANIYFGLDARLPVSLAESAASVMLGGAP